MKTTIKIAVIAMMVISSSMKAQTTEKRFDFGVKSGGNISNIINSYPLPSSMGINHKIGFYFGGFVNIRFSEKLKLQPELLYSNQGYNAEYFHREINFNYDYKFRQTQSYIYLPIVLQYYFLTKMNVELGMQAGYFISSRRKVTETSLSNGEGQTSSDLSDSDRFDFGFNLGAGYDLNEHLRINVRYSLGVININDFSKTSVWSLGLEYKI